MLEFFTQKIIIMMGITVSGVTLWMFAIGKSFKRIMMFLYLLCFLGGLAFNAWNMYMVIFAHLMFDFKSKFKLISFNYFAGSRF